jgi:hypothetical protein
MSTGNVVPYLASSSTSRLSMPSHRAAIFWLAVAGLAVFGLWQSTGVEAYLNALGGFCL